MAKYCGKNLLIQVETTPGGGTFATIGATNTASITINNETVDVTDKGGMPYRELLGCGMNTLSVSGGGQVSDDANFDIAHAAAVVGGTGAILNFRIISEKADQYEGAFLVTTFERSGDHNNAELFTFSLESAAQIAYTPAP